MSLAVLDTRTDIWRGDRFATADVPAVPSGFAELDAELPGGGWPRGALTELLIDGEGIGELALLMPALARVKAEGGWSMLIAPPHVPHAPAWSAAGVDLSRLAVVSPAAPRDALWAAEQALASGAPQAVLCWGGNPDPRQLRRLQVAAVAGNTLAFLFRPLRAALEASVAPLRIALRAGPQGNLSVSVFKRRGPPQAAPIRIALSRPGRVRVRELYDVVDFSPHPSAMAGHPAAAAGARSAPAAIA